MQQHPDYPLIIAANRDEYRNRPTAEMQWWPSRNILAGKDLVAGGTWLGLTANGYFSALTNFRIIPPINIETPLSRGELVLKALQQDQTLLENDLKENHHRYQGFNLLFGNVEHLTCFDSVNQCFSHFDEGFFSVCNGAVNDIWPKMAKGEQALEDYINKSQHIEHHQLLHLLKDASPAPDTLLPSTGLPHDWEKKLSAIFINGEEYGTRSSCVISLDKNQKIEVSEVTYQHDGSAIASQHYAWQLRA